MARKAKPRPTRKKESGTYSGAPVGPNPNWEPPGFGLPKIPAYDRPGYLPPVGDPGKWNGAVDLKERRP